jgi:hypothetical protein
MNFKKSPETGRIVRNPASFYLKNLLFSSNSLILMARILQARAGRKIAYAILLLAHASRVTQGKKVSVFAVSPRPSELFSPAAGPACLQFSLP